MSAHAFPRSSARGGTRTCSAAAKHMARQGDAPVLVPEALLGRPPRIRRHPDEDHVGRVARQATEPSRRARGEAELPRGEGRAGSVALGEALLELVVDAEAGERVGHLAHDRGGETGVGPSSEAWDGRGGVEGRRVIR